MKCFRCNVELRPVTNELPTQCYGGATFNSTGNYGSMFDPFDADKVIIVICDECIIENSENVIAANTPHIVQPATEYSAWRYVNSVRKQ